MTDLIAARIERWGTTAGDQLAVVAEERSGGYRGFTYADFASKTRNLAYGFADLGLTNGARVGLLVPPGRGLFEAAFGLMRAGATPVLIDSGIGRKRFGQCLAEADVSAVVGVPEALAARRLLSWAPGAEAIVVGRNRLPGVRSSDEIAEWGRSLVANPVIEAEVAVIVFTSGSTGPPKGVEYTGANLDAQAGMLADEYGMEPGVVNLATFAPFALLGPLLGMTTFLPRMDFANPGAVDPERILRVANDSQASMMFGSPALLDTVGRHGERTGMRLQYVKTILSAGAPVLSEIRDRILAMTDLDAEVFTPYGASEALPVTSIGSAELDQLSEVGICVGAPVTGMDVTLIEVTDEPVESVEAAGEVAQGGVGEIVVRGAAVTRGYHRRPEADRIAKLTWNGRPAHRMGDLGRFDGDGRLWFYGRKSHRVATEDGDLYTVPIESLFNRHPAVRRSALVGVGNGPFRVPVLCIEVEPGADAPDTIDVLAYGVGDPNASRVRTVLVHPSFPVDIRHNSKIDRPALAEWADHRLAFR